MLSRSIAALSFLIFRLVVESRWNVLGKATYVSNILPTKGPGAFSAAPGLLCLTRIKDLNMRVRLADPSLPTGLLINIFARDRSAFPSASEGAILRLSQLEVMFAYDSASYVPDLQQLTMFDGAPRATSAWPKAARSWSSMARSELPIPPEIAPAGQGRPRTNRTTTNLEGSRDGGAHSDRQPATAISCR